MYHKYPQLKDRKILGGHTGSQKKPHDLDDGGQKLCFRLWSFLKLSGETVTLSRSPPSAGRDQ